MTNSVLLTLLLTLATGLSIIAFNKPAVFSNMVVPLTSLCVALFVLVSVWHLGADNARRILAPFIHPQHTDAAAAALGASLPSVEIYAAICAVLALVVALGWLAAQIRAIEDKPEKHKD